tara:strand:- start:2989 stop:3504 length:516 start_codon:yes stop_codon:yes gene_type:complete
MKIKFIDKRFSQYAKAGVHFALTPLVPLAFFLLAACEGPVPTDLDRAAKVVRYMSRADVLPTTTFSKKYPDGKASDFVDWFLSEEGRSQWPASLSNADSNPEIRKEAYELNAPIVPRNMIFLAHKPDRKQGRQLVVKPDDSRNLIIVEGYADPNALPDLKREWELSRPANG